MERIPILTKDGSLTVSIPGMNVTYHSIHGAIQESMHVFIESGLDKFSSTGNIRILEIGLGTGLNVLLSFQYAIERKLKIQYTAIEKFPLTDSELSQIDYSNQLGKPELEQRFKQIHQTGWDHFNSLTDQFEFKKIKIDLETADLDKLEQIGSFNLIYFDAFGPVTQPELWTPAIFKKIVDVMSDDALLVTYCSKSSVRRAMKEAGLRVEKIPGPRGKREMVRAWKH